VTDRIETLGHSRIQHGKLNDRIYLMKLAREDLPTLPERLADLAGAEGYSKIFAKVPAWAEARFRELGYRVEARVPGFFRSETDAVFLGLFLDPARARASDAEQIEAALHEALRREPQPATFPDELSCRPCLPADAPAMAGLYRQVFETYPFPIHDPAYLRRTMETHILYFGVWTGGELVGLSSCETDGDARAVEMTDFAVRPQWRGKNLSVALLDVMEREMRRRGFVTAYTIARSVSFGMNIAFARAGYAFGGTLVNNTNICGRFESMNVWHKRIG